MRALLSERLLFGGTRQLDSSEAVGRAKALLVRSTTQPVRAPTVVHLDPIVSEADWQDYEQHRVVLEAGFGVDEPSARSMVLTLRQRAEHLGLALFLARDRRQDVGAIGRFHLPGKVRSWARLQEVDVFPAWRGRGYGDALLAAVVELLAAEGITEVVVGADEDDWPLSWYRRRGFQDVARVPLTR